MKKNAVIVIGGGVNGLGIVRNIGRYGIDVLCIIEKEDFACKSKYIKQSIVYSELISNHESVFNLFEKILETNDYEKYVIIPVSDQFVDFFARNKQKLKPNMLVNIPDSEIIDILINKNRFYSLLQTLNIPHPKTYSLKDIKNIDEILECLDFPFFLKPFKSHEFRAEFNGQKGFTINDTNDWYEKIKIISQKTIPVVVNEIIPGNSKNHFFIDGYCNQNGNIQSLFTRRRIHMHPLDWGNSTSMVSIPINQIQPAVEDLKRLLKHINYYGIFSAEVKYDYRDNLYKFIEINARSWWYNMFPTHCGTNIIKMIFDDLITGTINNNNELHLLNKYHIYLWPEIKAIIQMVKQKEKSLIDILKEMKFPASYPIFAQDDLLPFIWRFFERLQQFVYSIKKNIISIN